MLNLRHRLRHLSGEGDPFAVEPAMEVIYRDLFLRDLARLGEEDRFYPTGGAANYSLLYLILRLGVEFRPRSVLDIGAGQSSLLWSMLQRRGFVDEIVTLEHDRDWGDRIAAQVAHPVTVTPLRRVQIDGREALTYDWAAVGESAPFDVVVCDGPVGTPRHSRAGVVMIVEERLADDFALVLDDAERVGEQDTITLIHDQLQARDRDYGVGVVRAAKSQAVFATGRYLPATFL